MKAAIIYASSHGTTEKIALQIKNDLPRIICFCRLILDQKENLKNWTGKFHS